jgi:hypothetical protein
MYLLALALSGGLALAAASGLSAQDAPAAAPAAPAAPDGQGANIDDEPATVSDAAHSIERVALATRLADEARADGSAMGLAAAAEILRAEGLTRSERAKVTEGGDAAADASPPSGKSPYEPQALFAEAAQLARTANNEQLAMAIDAQASATKTRQSLRGGTEHYDRVRGNAIDVYTIAFRGHERAVAMAVAEGEHDIDLVVKDENGNTVASDRDSTHIGMCEWTPRWTGEFKLRVINTTQSSVNYSLLTN